MQDAREVQGGDSDIRATFRDNVLWALARYGAGPRQAVGASDLAEPTIRSWLTLAKAPSIVLAERLARGLGLELWMVLLPHKAFVKKVEAGEIVLEAPFFDPGRGVSDLGSKRSAARKIQPKRSLRKVAA